MSTPAGSRGGAKGKQKRTTPGIPRWSPTRVLVWPSPVYRWESGRDPEFSGVCGRTYRLRTVGMLYTMVSRVRWVLYRCPAGRSCLLTVLLVPSSVPPTSPPSGSSLVVTLPKVVGTLSNVENDLFRVQSLLLSQQNTRPYATELSSSPIASHFSSSFAAKHHRREHISRTRLR